MMYVYLLFLISARLVEGFIPRSVYGARSLLSAFPDDQIDATKNFLATGQKSLQEGASFKQALADAIAGDNYDEATTRAEIETEVQSAPLVVYAWTVSIFSKKALSALEMVDKDIKVKVINLDKPWSEGNKVRAVLGRMVGRTSVPAIFVGGKYIGGYEDGPNEESPGLVPLAFRGELRKILVASGAIEKDFMKDV
jgi:glutaredoxin